VSSAAAKLCLPKSKCAYFFISKGETTYLEDGCISDACDLGHVCILALVLFVVAEDCQKDDGVERECFRRGVDNDMDETPEDVVLHHQLDDGVGVEVFDAREQDADQAQRRLFHQHGLRLREEDRVEAFHEVLPKK